MFLSPYSPELNGAERIWDYAKCACANLYFEPPDALSVQVATRITALINEQVASIAAPLTHYFIVQPNIRRLIGITVVNITSIQMRHPAA